MRITLRRTCETFPSQWEGINNTGQFIYARHRHGSTTVGIGAGKNAAVENGMSDEPFWSSEDGAEDEFMADSELIGLMAKEGHEVTITTTHMTGDDFGHMMDGVYEGLLTMSKALPQRPVDTAAPRNNITENDSQ